MTKSFDRPYPNPDSDRGFVLILVIWIAALVALIALAFSASVRSHLKLISNTIQSAKAEALADAGVELAALALISEAQPASRTAARSRRFPVDGSPTACAVDGQGRITLRVQDTGGRISLNLAGERLLQALFIGLGASRELASRYADTIIDYRDADSNRRPNGAEQPEYADAGRPAGPKNAPFDTLEELNQVLGLEPAMIALITPYVTVHSQTAGLDPRATTVELAVLLARGVEQLPARSSLQSATGGALPGEFVIGSPQRVFLITSEARTDAGAVFVRETVAELQSTLNAVPAYKIWRRGAAAAAEAPAPEALPPC